MKLHIAYLTDQNDTERSSIWRHPSPPGAVVSLGLLSTYEKSPALTFLAFSQPRPVGVRALYYLVSPHEIS